MGERRQWRRWGGGEFKNEARRKWFIPLCYLFTCPDRPFDWTAFDRNDALMTPLAGYM